MARLLLNPFVSIFILFVLSLAVIAKGDPAQNTTTSPWFEQVISHHRLHRSNPRQLGCRWRPWICRRGEHPPGVRMRCCRNQCVDVSSDVNHCGLCIIRCPFGWQCCRGFCVNVMFCRFNCGRCGHRCPWRSRCVYGMCGYA